MLLNILICTAVMWVLQVVLVVPISNYFANRKLLTLGLPVFSSGASYEDLPEDEKSVVEKVATNSYIVTDVLVMGLTGLLAGLLFGLFFIGVSFDKRGWPGTIAFVVLSLLGSGVLNG